MMVRSTAREVDRVVRLSLALCLVFAVISVVAATLAGRALTGGLLATGLVIGAANGFMAQRLFSTSLPFMATSMLRIMTLPAAAAAVGLVIGLDHVWLIIAGLGAAQLLMSGSALREMKR